ncbi:MAG: hypothetical protein EA369_00725 [Bradymonadales bacterium]|nr:MAG: hypothetical protein EA369_00725 [Bradymonadales bacterium]
MTDLFHFFSKLEQDRWSGEVQVTASEGNAFLVFLEGEFLYAYRPLDRAVEKLQEVRWLRMPPEQVTQGAVSWEAIVLQLLRENREKEAKLVRHLKSDRYEIFFRIFFWTNVDLIPIPDDSAFSPSLELSFYSPRSISRLLNEAKARLEEWPKIQKRIGSSHRVFACRVPSSELEKEENRQKDAVDQALERFSDTAGIVLQGDARFSDEQIELLRLCDGHNNVQDIIRKSYSGEFLTLRRLIELWDQGAVGPRDEDSSRSHGSKSPLSFKELKAGFLVCVFVAAVSGFFFWSQPTPQVDLAPVQSALEIYRGVHGRYPLTLQELQLSRVIAGQSFDGLAYRLVSLDRYELEWEWR